MIRQEDERAILDSLASCEELCELEHVGNDLLGNAVYRCQVASMAEHDVLDVYYVIDMHGAIVDHGIDEVVGIVGKYQMSLEVVSVSPWCGPRVTPGYFLDVVLKDAADRRYRWHTRSLAAAKFEPGQRLVVQATRSHNPFYAPSERTREIHNVSIIETGVAP